MSDEEVLLGDADNDIEINLQGDYASNKEESLDNVVSETVEAVTIDEFLQKTGECGRFQITIQFLIMVTMLPMSYIPLIFYFIGHDPSWGCSEQHTSNTSVCFNHSRNKVFAHNSQERCKLNRSEWDFRNDGRGTLVTEFDLVCNRAWLDALSGAIVFIGWGIGILTLGYLSDRYGRKKVMYPALFLTLLALMSHAFATQIWQIIVIRFFMGFFYSGPALNNFVLIVELFGPSRRVLAATIGNGIWTLGAFLMTLKSYYIKNWRYLTLVCSIPYMLGIFTYICVPESVRWLNVKGKTKEAEKILHKAAKRNKKRSSHLTLKNDDASQKFKKKTSYIDLFRSCRMTKLTLAQAFIWFDSGMVYYSLSWAFADLGGDMFVNFLLSIIIEIPGGLISLVLMEKVGRKKTTILSFFFTGIFSFAVACTPMGHHLKVLRMIFGLSAKCMVTISFSCIYMWSSEVWATSIRTQGMGICVVTSRAGAAVSPFIKILDKIHPAAPFIFMAATSILSGFFSFALPETLRQPTREKIEDMFKEKPLTVRAMYSMTNGEVYLNGSNENVIQDEGEEETDRLLSADETPEGPSDIKL